MSHAQLLATFENLGSPRVLVLGDFMLDRYTWGEAERISQEAPVILLRAQRREVRLGGAANVCQMLRGLEAQVTAAGVVGDDEDGRTVRRMLADAGVDAGGLLADRRRPTTVKERFMGRAQGRHPHQIMRVDSEVRDPLHQELEDNLIERLTATIADHQMILVSDYGKGVCTERLVQTVIGLARMSGVPVLVDPFRGADYTRYQGATAITPNRAEAEVVAGRKIARPEDALELGRGLCRDLDLEMAIITLDRDGMALVRRDGQGGLLPTRPRAVYDITGAGDMVLAMVGMALAAGASPEDAIRLGNIAGGLEVEQVGVAVIRRDAIRSELLSARHGAPAKLVTLDQLAAQVASHRCRGESIVFTNGCFDLLHVGHVTCLEDASTMGDVLVVGINSDAGVRRLKGVQRPVIGQADRAAMLAALACVDYVVVFDEDTPHEILRAIRPDILVKGGTYAPAEVVGHELVEAYGGRVRVTRTVEGISTSGILASLAGKHTALAGPDSPPLRRAGRKPRRFRFPRQPA
ncbi:MAG: D-glycero-beta-D-manno-heptose 1-phosphate adenylyltransferase [Pirellulales bacterium]